jgi:hypothetical protein
MTQKNISSEGTGAESEYAGANLPNAAKQAAKHVATDARAGLDARLAARKDRAGEGLHSVADALRGTREELRERNPLVGDYADRAAEKLDELSEMLRTRSVDDLVSGVEKFARREPALFFGGAFALGVIAARFLKSSSHRTTQTDDARRYELDDAPDQGWGP